MFDRTLVPLDGSKLAERALTMALQIVPAGAEIVLLSVPLMEHTKQVAFGLPGMAHRELEWPQARQQAADYLDALCTAHVRSDVTYSVVLVQGDPASCISDTATAHKVDAIVMSAHGASGISRWAMGSVAEKVVRAAPCPVLIVRDPQPVRRILVPLDGSQLGEYALPCTLALAAYVGAHVTLLRVVEQILVLQPSHHGYEYLTPELDLAAQQAAVAEAGRYLQAVAGRHSLSDVPLETMSRKGPVAETILNVADAESIDLIAMATHGRTGLRRWVYGSIAEKVLRRSRCAVLLVRVPTHLLRGESAMATSV